MSIATWKLPKGIAADKASNIIQRMQHYRFLMQHYLNDGTRIIPTIPTVRHILDSHDQFNLPVAVSVNSYIVYTEDIS